MATWIRISVDLWFKVFTVELIKPSSFPKLPQQTSYYDNNAWEGNLAMHELKKWQKSLHTDSVHTYTPIK